MTDNEKAIVEKLAEVWNAFIKLPIEHPDDINEFRQGIHTLQNKVLARPARRNFDDFIPKNQ